MVRRAHDFSPALRYVSILSTKSRSKNAAVGLKDSLLAAGVAEVVYIHEAEEDRNGHRGCWRGHKDIALRALRLGYTTTAVFEDDAILSNFFLENFSAIARVIQGVGEWDVFFLGHNPERLHIPPLQNTEGLDRVLVRLKAWSTVGYIMRGQMLESIAYSQFETLPEGTVDGILHSSRHAWGFYPMLVTHPDNYSRTTGAVRHLHWRQQESLLFNMAQLCVHRAAVFSDLAKFVNGYGTIKCQNEDEINAFI